MRPVYTYNAKVQSVYDGDTVTAAVDLGFGLWNMGTKCRLYGIDTPELRGDTIEAGRAAKYALQDKLDELGWAIVLESHGKGKYGRWLVTLHTPEGRNLNDELIAEGFAVPY